MLDDPPLLKKLLVQDRVAIWIGLAGVTLLSWLYLIGMADNINSGAPMVMEPASVAWSAEDARIVFAMWWIMMVGMMLPSAAPMILTFATINRKKREREQPFVTTVVFASGYLAVWGAFSILATGTQWALQKASLISPMLVANNAYLAGALFVSAGIYQWTPLKNICLRYCRSPLNYIIRSWREGRRGALIMGWQHGLYCLGCCWLVMGLLFAVGVMNLVWVGAIAAFVFMEKLFPAGEWIARLSGTLMIFFGVYLAASG